MLIRNKSLLLIPSSAYGIVNIGVFAKVRNRGKYKFQHSASIGGFIFGCLFFTREYLMKMKTPL